MRLTAPLVFNHESNLTQIWPQFFQIASQQGAIIVDGCERSGEEDHRLVVPADDKANARLIISQIFLHTLKDMKLKYPRLEKSSSKTCARRASNLVRPVDADHTMA